MLESEFKERIKSIKDDLNEIFNNPLVQTHKIGNKEENFNQVVVDTHLRKLLYQIAANIVQIEDGITRYARPKEWELIQEGVKELK